MNNWQKILLFSIIFFLFVNLSYLSAEGGPRIKISVSNKNQPWPAVVDQSSVTGTAGSDTDAIESVSCFKTLTINQSSGGWKMEFGHGNPNPWDNNFVLQLCRYGSGTGGSVSGGTSYTTLTTTARVLFTGSGDVSAIPLQYRFGSGIIGQNINTDEYETTIEITVTYGY